MAITRTISNKFKLEVGKGTVDISTAEFRVILMSTAFAFDPDTNGAYSDVSASELVTGGGYTQIAKVLTNETAWAQDNVNDKAAVAWNDATWTATTGGIGPTGAAIILVHDSATPANSLLVGCIDFGDDLTIADGVSFQLQNMGFDFT